MLFDKRKKTFYIFFIVASSVCYFLFFISTTSFAIFTKAYLKFEYIYLLAEKSAVKNKPNLLIMQKKLTRNITKVAQFLIYSSFTNTKLFYCRFQYRLSASFMIILFHTCLPQNK